MNTKASHLPWQQAVQPLYGYPQVETMRTQQQQADKHLQLSESANLESHLGTLLLCSEQGGDGPVSLLPFRESFFYLAASPEVELVCKKEGPGLKSKRGTKTRTCF